MKKFQVYFELVNNTKRFFYVESENYSLVASKVFDSEDGWFGIEGEAINLSNAVYVKIDEIDSNDTGITFVSI